MQRLIEKYFNISHDASASLIITLLTFILGYLITATVYVLSRYFNRRANRKMFVSTLASLAKTLKAQENSFTTLLESMNFQENTLWSYSKVDFFQILTFQELGYKESYKSFFYGFESFLPSFVNKKLKRKAFNKTWSLLNNMDFWEKKALADFYPLLEKYNTHGDARNNAMNDLRIMWEKLFTVDPATISPTHLDYLKKQDGIIASFAKTPTLKRVGPYFAHRNLILKIRILNKKFRLLPFVREFNDKCMEVSSHYLNMEMLVRNTREQYKVYYHSFREFRRVTQKIIKILD